MIFSIKKLVISLIDIITGSPTSILFIVLGLIFTIAMIINIKKNKTIGKTLYLIGWIFIIAFIIIKYNNYLSKIIDNLINTIFMQIFFPNLATYTIIIIITNIIFLYTVFNKKTNTINKLINSPFFIIIMVLMVYTIDLISKNKINVYQRKEVYSNSALNTIIESTTLIFTLWMIILLSKFILKKLIKKSDEKIIEEFKSKNNNDEIFKSNESVIQPISQTPFEIVNQVPVNQNNEVPSPQIVNQTHFETANQIPVNQSNEVPSPQIVNQIPFETANQIPVNQNNEVSSSQIVNQTPFEMINQVPVNQNNEVPSPQIVNQTPFEMVNQVQVNQSNETTNIPNIFDTTPTENQNIENVQPKPILIFPKEDEIEVLKL